MFLGEGPLVIPDDPSTAWEGPSVLTKGLTRAGLFLSGAWRESRGEGRRHVLEQLHRTLELAYTLESSSNWEISKF